MIKNPYASNNGAHDFITQILLDLKGERGSNIIIVGDFITLLSPVDRTSTQKNQQVNIRVKLHHRKMDLHLQNIPSNSCRIHILFTSTEK